MGAMIRGNCGRWNTGEGDQFKHCEKLRDYLEASDVEVILTREDDRGLYEETDTQKKTTDMRNRCAKINEEKPDLMVSIHQNSYHQEAISGGQVFTFPTRRRERNWRRFCRNALIMS